MVLKSVREIKKKWRTVAAGLVFLFVAGISLPAPSVAAAAYSCGSYSSGAYSENATCATSGGGSGTSDPVTAPGAPNTGVAKLMEPANLAAIIGSLALIIAGVIIVIKSRRSKKQNVSFDS